MDPVRVVVLAANSHGRKRDLLDRVVGRLHRDQNRVKVPFCGKDL